MRKNYKIIQSISEKRLTQAEVVRQAKISSEARLSRIIHYLVFPKKEEVLELSNLLELTHEEIRGEKYGI